MFVYAYGPALRGFAVQHRCTEPQEDHWQLSPVGKLNAFASSISEERSKG